MALPEYRKRANANWNAKNLSTLGCTIRKDKADAFRKICESKGLKVNAVLSEFVDNYIKENSPEN